MILFLGCSLTWGQGLYFEKWRDEGFDVMRWKKSNGNLDVFPHENLDYESHQYRRQHHFPALVAKHYNRNYDVKWGNGGSNWDIIHQINAIPFLSPQFRNGLDLVVIQLTNWTRNDNRLLYKKDLYEQAIPELKNIIKEPGWENRLIDEMMEDEALYQIQKMKELLDELGLKWIAISWLDDMGKLLEKHFPENYVPFYLEGSKYNSFEVCFGNNKYTLEEEFKDEHLNKVGCKLVADSIIKKIDSIGGRSIFNYIRPTNQNII